MNTYSPQFLEGFENAKLCMSHPDFGFCPYYKGSEKQAEWNLGFEHAFTVGKLLNA